jgi:pimeloyl-ACP methyl ester carboxylesterase
VGSQPYGGDPPQEWVPILERGARAWVEGVVPAPYRSWFSPDRMDGRALAAWISLREHAGLADDLATLSMPCLLLVGETDDARPGALRCAEAMPAARCITIAGADHLESIARVDFVLSSVREFLEGVRGQG